MEIGDAEQRWAAEIRVAAAASLGDFDEAEGLAFTDGRRDRVAIHAAFRQLLVRRRELAVVVAAMTSELNFEPIQEAASGQGKSGPRRALLFEIVKAMKPMTVRQVFYQATVQNIVEKTEASYTKVQTDLALMRRAGELPYDWLADNTRWQRKPTTFNGIEEALKDTACFYRKSLWADAEVLSRRSSTSALVALCRFMGLA